MSNLPPSGEIPRGAIRFNTDSNKPELWDGSQWAEFQLSTPNLGRSVDTEPGARGVISEVHRSGSTGFITYINISSTGNAQDFGALTNPRANAEPVGSQTRGVFGAGYVPSPSNASINVIEFVTIASTGSVTDFGDTLNPNYVPGAVSSSTRGIWGGGANLPAAPTLIDVMQYVTIASTGNTVDFGNLTDGCWCSAGVESPTRGIFAQGFIPSVVNNLDFITISTLGNAQDFGDLTVARAGTSGAGNKVRGLFMGGYNPTVLNVIDYITMASTGDAANFGDLTQVARFGGATSDSRRALLCGRYTPSASNVIDYVQIMTEGDAIDFGDCTSETQAAATSSGHGGL